MTHRHSLSLLLALTLAACAGAAEAPSPDGIDDIALPGGKADLAGLTPCQEEEIVSWLNEPGTDVALLQAASVHTRAARNLIAHRDGADGSFGTVDDDLFDNLVEVDDVSYVGPVAMEQLGAAVAARCTAPTTDASVEVIFSPQPFETSHLAKAIELMNGAERSLDIAMYSFSDTRVRDALIATAQRGISVRVIYDGASSDRTSPGGTLSARLEDAGIEVRWINKIMHNKFMVVDGARSSLDQARSAWLMTGSGNWSGSAGSTYDENTVVAHGHEELNLRYQAEFNHLWAHSRPVVWNESIAPVSAIDIASTDIPDDVNADAVFTSANFRTYVSSRYGETFSVLRGHNTVADRLVEIIGRAQHSIRIASGHLRSRPVAEALTAAVRANPGLDIRIYLDQQEYVSDSANDKQERELAACLDAAGTSEAQIEDCYDRGFMYSYAMMQEGIGLRFKYYAYHWDYHYAEQMHDKYILVDDRWLATGSYNLSDNAEHGTMENVALFDANGYPELVRAYAANFDRIWETGRDDGHYEALLADVNDGVDPFPIVFPAVALTWDQVVTLKHDMAVNCSQINTAPFRDNPNGHRTCYPTN